MIMVHDMQAILLVRHFKIQPFTILEICHAAHDYEIIKAQPELGLMMPCKILVRMENGQTLISGMRFSVLEPYLDNANMESVFRHIERDIQTIIDESK